MMTRLLLLAPIPVLLFIGTRGAGDEMLHVTGLVLSAGAACVVLWAHTARDLAEGRRTMVMLAGLSLLCMATAGLVRGAAPLSLSLAAAGLLLAVLASRRRFGSDPMAP